MSDGEVQSQATVMTISKGFGVYLAFMVGLIVLIKLASTFSWFSGFVPFLAYFVFGFILNRKVMRGLVEWHPAYNTLENVASGKLNSLLFWPLAYPVLFMKLGITKHL